MRLHALSALAGLGLMATLAACGGAPSESEFVQACLQSSSPGATEKTCACAAREAKKVSSDKVYRAMVLNMQGNKRDADALLEDLSFEERVEVGLQQMGAIMGCIAEEQ